MLILLWLIAAGNYHPTFFMCAPSRFQGTPRPSTSRFAPTPQLQWWHVSSVARNEHHHLPAPATQWMVPSRISRLVEMDTGKYNEDTQGREMLWTKMDSKQHLRCIYHHVSTRVDVNHETKTLIYNICLILPFHIDTWWYYYTEIQLFIIPSSIHAAVLEAPPWLGDPAVPNPPCLVTKYL